MRTLEEEGGSASPVEREHPGGRGGVPRGGDAYFSLRGSHRGQRLDEARATLMKVEIYVRLAVRKAHQSRRRFRMPCRRRPGPA